MASFADRVKETTQSSGLEDYSLRGSMTGFRPFSAGFSNSDTIYYCCENNNDWEVGQGTLISGANGWTISREVILASSNGGAKVIWEAGTKNIYCTYPASAIISRLDLLSSIGSALVGFLQAGTNAIARTVQSKLQDTVSVKDFGAVGNGIADDTSAFSAALASVGNQGVVLVPYSASGYFLSGGIVVGGGVTLQGTGERVTQLAFATDSSTPAITIAQSYYSKIKNLRIRHNNKASSGIGIFSDGGINNAAYGSVESVTIDQFITGLKITGEHTWMRFLDVHAINATVGFHLENCNLAVLERCIADQTDQKGFFLDGVAKAIIQKCTSQYSALTGGTHAGMELLNVLSADIDHNWFEGNRSHNIYLRGACQDITIRDNLIQGAGSISGSGTGIRVDGTATRTLIDGNTFASNASQDIYTESTTSKTVILNPRKASVMNISDNASDTVRHHDGRLTWKSGNVGFGEPASTTFGLVMGQTLTGGNSQYGQVIRPTIDSGSTTLGIGIYVAPKTAAASFTVTDTYGVRIAPWSKGSGSAITNQYGLYVDSITGAATINYAIYTAGTAKSIFSGGIGIGNSAAASGPVGSVVKKIEIFDAAGNSLGFIPVYNSIT